MSAKQLVLVPRVFLADFRASAQRRLQLIHDSHARLEKGLAPVNRRASECVAPQKEGSVDFSGGTPHLQLGRLHMNGYASKRQRRHHNCEYVSSQARHDLHAHLVVSRLSQLGVKNDTRPNFFAQRTRYLLLELVLAARPFPRGL
jgi:hypothetical protein